ncbi:GLPGLI family protein [Leeuwenhoekiella marinoflava]|uniref:GLPGLI family protein n=2 Tax=Leeuwenhoekiella marinoflava TaxID=988 RepID=A0A4Q0PM15_9FLAO|nr:GLPGLI family protein [Leeuwenhoekiella marinoflava]RXG29174.1 GLPGLI family protein [Leeuwenhoekiella marinoflava]SHF34050.1 GLPGLI family protein [Leeuwenhoekiella marinoflava DSM 3653]
MKNKFSIYFILMLPLLSFAQINTGEIYYQVSIDIEKNIKEIDKKDLSPMVKMMMRDTYKNTKPVELILYFDKKYSLSRAVLDLDKPDEGVKILEIVSGVKYEVYTSQSPHQILKSGGSLGNVLVEETLPQWTLLDETKNIGIYTAYQAQGYKMVEGSKGIVKRDFIAWYTPEIPVQYGPYLYSGLPGLILEVQVGEDLVFKATDITINGDEAVEINIPKYKIITQEEANAKYKSYLKN